MHLPPFLTTTGIGLAVTKQAHDLGAKLVVADLKTTPDFDSFAQGKDNVLYVQADVAHWPDFDKIFAACTDKWNDVPDAYAICAGLFEPPFSNFWDDPEQDSGYKQVDVNVNHPIKLTRLAIRKSLQKGKRASVCIIVSLSLFCLDFQSCSDAIIYIYGFYVLICNCLGFRGWYRRLHLRTPLLRNQTRHGGIRKKHERHRTPHRRQSHYRVSRPRIHAPL
jgi:hypothetical protein